MKLCVRNPRSKFVNLRQVQTPNIIIKRALTLSLGNFRRQFLYFKEEGFLARKWLTFTPDTPLNLTELFKDPKAATHSCKIYST